MQREANEKLPSMNGHGKKIYIFQRGRKPSLNSLKRIIRNLMGLLTQKVMPVSKSNSSFCSHFNSISYSMRRYEPPQTTNYNLRIVMKQGKKENKRKDEK